MKRQFALLVAGLVGVLILAGQLARAAPIQVAPFPNDSDPYWSWDTRYIAFDREAASVGSKDVYVVASGHGAQRWLAPTRARGWRPGGGGILIEYNASTAIFTSNGAPLGGVNGLDASWSPDGGRVAYVRGETLYVSDATGAHERAAFSPVIRASWDVTGPAWSPDGSRIAVASGASLYSVAPDGSQPRLLATGRNQNVNPSWSHDGSTIAYESNDDPAAWTIRLVDADGTNARAIANGGWNDRYPQWSPIGRQLAFVSDRRHEHPLVGGATFYRFDLYALRPDDGLLIRLLDDVRPDSPARWAPTGGRLAVAAGQECGRWGIYTVESYGGARRRVSNLCHVNGTTAGDVLRGGPYYDIIRGFAGRDTIDARDGQRDLVDCGPGRDVAYVDRLDVTHHCEVVRRP
ncbi:MAG: TolB protein [Gaiellaceae bacterium]|nr:TolB protein [Gaiellaceae bacterium]